MSVKYFSFFYRLLFLFVEADMLAVKMVCDVGEIWDEKKLYKSTSDIEFERICTLQCPCKSSYFCL